MMFDFISNNHSKMKKMKISQEKRNEIVRLYSEHVPIKELMKRFEVSRSSIYNFLKLDQVHKSTNGSMTVTFRKITSMESELERLRQENEILKTCGCYIDAPLSERLTGIDRLSEKDSFSQSAEESKILRCDPAPVARIQIRRGLRLAGKDPGYRSGIKNSPANARGSVGGTGGLHQGFTSKCPWNSGQILNRGWGFSRHSASMVL